MNNKAVLPVAIALASGFQSDPVKSAMYINDHGIGETLVFPRYSVENGNNTLINVANTAGDHKAVKVRILEAVGSQEVLDFNLYLSPLISSSKIMI